MWERQKPKIRRRSTEPASQFERNLNKEFIIFPSTADNVIESIIEKN
jgi:hypothetical protein